MPVVRSRTVAEPDLRYGQLSRGVLALLEGIPDGLAVQDVIDQIALAVPPTPSELVPSQRSPEVSRYEEAVRRSTIAPAKAGWLIKAGGVWRITEKGRRALSRFPDPLAFYRAAIRRRDPDVADTAAPSDVGDIFAGCFLALAGSLVGAVVGTIVLLVRMLPDVSLSLIGGFGAAFVVGVVVGFIASFPMASFAITFGPRAENVWLGGTALAAAAAAALTPSLLISVDAIG